MPAPHPLEQKLDRLLAEFAETAVIADGLASRLYSLGHIRTCTRVRKAARELALACGHHTALQRYPALFDTFAWSGNDAEQDST